MWRLFVSRSGLHNFLEILEISKLTQFLILIGISSYALIASSAIAQDNLEEPVMASLRGRCIRVVVEGQDLPANCSPDPSNAVLINTNYSNGRSGFYVVSNGYIIVFSGMGSMQVKPDPDSVVQPVDLVLFNKVSIGNITQLRAAGTCSYENPNRGIPTKVMCNAQTEHGLFIMEFLHDGSPLELITPPTNASLDHSWISDQDIVWFNVHGTDIPSRMNPDPNPATIGVNTIIRHGDEIIFDAVIDGQYVRYNGNCASGLLYRLLIGLLDENNQPTDIRPYPNDRWFSANPFQKKILVEACSYFDH